MNKGRTARTGNMDEFSNSEINLVVDFFFFLSLKY